MELNGYTLYLSLRCLTEGTGRCFGKAPTDCFCSLFYWLFLPKNWFIVFELGLIKRYKIITDQIVLGLRFRVTRIIPLRLGLWTGFNIKIIP